MAYYKTNDGNIEFKFEPLHFILFVWLTFLLGGTLAYQFLSPTLKTGKSTRQIAVDSCISRGGVPLFSMLDDSDEPSITDCKFK